MRQLEEAVSQETVMETETADIPNVIAIESAKKHQEKHTKASETNKDVIESNLPNETNISQPITPFKKPPPGPSTNKVRLVDKTFRDRMRTRSKSATRQDRNTPSPSAKKDNQAQVNDTQVQGKNTQSREKITKLSEEREVESLPKEVSSKSTRTRSKSGASVSTSTEGQESNMELSEDTQNPSSLTSRTRRKSASACIESTSPKATLRKGKRKGAAKIYRCEECKIKYSGCGALRNHIQSVHLGIVYSCMFCEYKSGQAGNLKVHLKKKHAT